MSDSLPPASAGLPASIGRYRILERIGQGGMGKVYRAVAEGPEGFRREVALKVVLQGTENDALRLQMFHDEARIVARLTHPGIAQVYDFGVEEGQVYLVMELVAGRSMHQILGGLRKEGQRLPEAVAMAIGTQAASALAYAHSAAGEDGAPMKLVHRDISPDNLLVADQGWVKLLDFGIVKAAGRDVQTQAGQVKGKPAYMSPEQVQGHPIDGRSDIFGLGVVLWESLAGERLWRGSDMTTVIAQLLTEPIRHLADLQPDLHPSASDAVMAMLAREPGQRPDARAAQEMLSRTLSAIRAGSPQEIVAAWQRGELPPVSLRPAGEDSLFSSALPGALGGAPGEAAAPSSTVLAFTPTSPTAPTGPGPEAAWDAMPLTGEAAAAAPTIDGGELSAPEPGPRRDLSASSGFQSFASMPVSPPEESRPDEPALELAFEPVPAPMDAPPSEAPAPPSGLDLSPPRPPELSSPGPRPGARPPPVTGERASRAAPGAASPAPPWKAIGMVVGGLALVGVLGFLASDFLFEEEVAVGPAADGKVTLQIETTPPGATLVVNGQEIGEPSPTSVQTLALREHEISARLPGHVPTTVKISYAQADDPVRITLQRLITIEVITDPPGAQVTCDGRVVILETPGSFVEPPGDYHLLATLDGRAPQGVAVSLENKPFEWRPTLPKAAYLQVKTRPPGAELILDGVPLGLTSPARIAIAPRKRATLEARLGVTSARKKIRGPAPGKQARVSLVLVDPVARAEAQQDRLQLEVDRLGELIQTANRRIETGILSEREVRKIVESRDTLQQRQDRLNDQVEELENRLTLLRAAEAELQR